MARLAQPRRARRTVLAVKASEASSLVKRRATQDGEGEGSQPRRHLRARPTARGWWKTPLRRSWAWIWSKSFGEPWMVSSRTSSGWVSSKVPTSPMLAVPMAATSAGKWFQILRVEVRRRWREKGGAFAIVEAVTVDLKGRFSWRGQGTGQPPASVMGC